MPADCIRNESVSCETSRSFKVKMKHMACIRLRMNHKLAYCHCCRSSLGAEFIESQGTRSRTAVGRDVGGTHRRRKYSVAIDYITEPDRAGQMWILVCRHNGYDFVLFYKISHYSAHDHANFGKGLYFF